MGGSRESIEVTIETTSNPIKRDFAFSYSTMPCMTMAPVPCWFLFENVYAKALTSVLLWVLETQEITHLIAQGLRTRRLSRGLNEFALPTSSEHWEIFVKRS